MNHEEFQKEIQEIKAQLLDTTREYGKGIQEINDRLLVTARMMELHERESNGRLDRIEGLALRHEERLGELEAAMQACFQSIDRFIRGQEGNGQKGKQ